MHATQNVKVFSSFYQPQKNFRQRRGHQRAVEVTGSTFFGKKTVSINGIEHPQKFSLTKIGKTVHMVFRRINSYFVDTGDKRHTGKHPDVGN